MECALWVSPHAAMSADGVGGPGYRPPEGAALVPLWRGALARPGEGEAWPCGGQEERPGGAPALP